MFSHGVNFVEEGKQIHKGEVHKRLKGYFHGLMEKGVGTMMSENFQVYAFKTCIKAQDLTGYYSYLALDFYINTRDAC